MKIINTICFIILLQVNLSLLIDNEASMNYTNKSYFAVIGVTGEGKSSFVNVLSAKSNFKESTDGNSETQKIQDIEFDFGGNSLIAIDTPGLDDSLYNAEKIRNLKTLILEYPTLRCLIIIKKYNNFRLSESLQEAIKVFMESFPLENFWDHVIIVNTYANPKDESFKYYTRKQKQYFVQKINKCKNLKDFMFEKKIKIPDKITEYFIDTKFSKKEMQKKFIQIKKDIISKELMFKKIERGEIEKEVEESNKKNIYIVKEFRRIICTDFKDQTKEIKEYLSERKEELSDSNLIRTDVTDKFIKTDYVRWYDVLTLSLTWWFRTKELYEVYEQKVHKIGNKEIKEEKEHTKDIWKR